MSAEPRLSTRNYVFDPRPAYPYVSAVKRYWIEGSPYLNDEDAITLVLTHGTGFTKELWEPAIDDLLAMNVREGGKIKIREIWAIDSPNHGESAVLNAKEFQKGPNLICEFSNSDVIYTLLTVMVKSDGRSMEGRCIYS